MKKLLGYIFTFTLVVCLCGCSNKAFDEAKNAVDNYNSQVASYNEQVAVYNKAVQEIDKKNQELDDVLNGAQDVIDKIDESLADDTLATLKDAMSTALKAKVDVPDVFNTYETIMLDEKLKDKDELKEIATRANAEAEKIASSEKPTPVPEIPDYTEEIQNVTDALQAYEESMKGIEQLYAPSDEFVMERLKMVDTITDIEAVTEDHDPNGKLNKQGGYIGCIYFTDSQVDRTELYILDGEGVVDVGCKGGGALEIFRTVEDALAREQYLAAFDGTAFCSGSHCVYGTILVRTSDSLTGTQQRNLTEKIVDALTYIEKE